MAYNTKELTEQALQVAEEHCLYFIEDVVAYLPCSKPTFYEHKVNEVNELKEILYRNRTQKKVRLRKKWEESNNATLQLALYKLLANDTEHRRLAMEYRDHTTDGNPLDGFTITIKNASNGHTE